MDAIVGLPLVEPLSVPPAVLQSFPFLTSSRPATFAARLYALVPAVVLTGSRVDGHLTDPSASGDDTDTEAPVKLLKVEPRDVLVGVSYSAVFVCDFQTSTVCAVFPFGGSSSPLIAAATADSPIVSVPRLCAVATAQDEESWVVLQCEPSSNKKGDATPPITQTGNVDVMLQVPAPGLRAKLIASLQRVHQHHAPSSATSSLVHKVVAQASELRTAWEVSQQACSTTSDGMSGRATPNKGAIGIDVPSCIINSRTARQLLVPLQARWVLNRRGAPLVVDRMKQARDEYQDAEEATNAALAEIERGFDRLFGQLDSRFSNLSVEDNVLSRWDRELEEKEALSMMAEAELRRSKDAARQIALEKEKAIVRCTEELQSWRRILSTKQQEELHERESLLAEEHRIRLARQDGARVLDELQRELASLQEENAQFEAPEYVALVEARDAKLRDLKEFQQELSDFEADVVPQIKKRLAEAQRKISILTDTNDALRKLIMDSERDIAVCSIEGADLTQDQSSAANDIVGLEDALLLVDLELAQAEKERNAAREACHDADGRIQALNAQTNQNDSSLRLRDPGARYRVAKLRVARARKEQQGAELLAHRAASVHRSGTCELQQQILFEAIRLKSPPSASSVATLTTAQSSYFHQSTANQNRLNIESESDGTTNFVGDVAAEFADHELDAMLSELLA